MAIVRTDIPITSESCEQMILAIVEKYPFCRTEIISTTAFQRSLQHILRVLNRYLLPDKC